MRVVRLGLGADEDPQMVNEVEMISVNALIVNVFEIRHTPPNVIGT